MRNQIIPYGKQNITEEDIESVVIALKGEYLTQGPKILEFEKLFANYVGSRFAVAVSNGTAALHLSAIALNLKKGEKVITTPITFAASANCIRYCDGDVIFSDIDSESYLIDLNKIEELISKYPKGTIKGIIPVDFAGRAVNLEKVKELANKYNLWIIEDACHAPGGFFIDSKGIKQKCGNGNFADLSIFSFHPVKHIATGEGGMITTNNENLYNRLLDLRSHGITRIHENFLNTIEFSSGSNNQSSFPGWYMEMQTLGYNYRFTDFQAALGISQLNRAEEGLFRRKNIAEKYKKAFSGKKFLISQSDTVIGHAYHLYILEVKDRIGLYNHLKNKNIYAQIHYIPCHLMPYYRNLGWKDGDMPIAESYYKNCISIPMYPSMTDDDVDFVIDEIINFYE
jgi:UDP-4-amino-4,6-dideoxy-N-acetyl-beta-L-altrosamine transaminase